MKTGTLRLNRVIVRSGGFLVALSIAIAPLPSAEVVNVFEAIVA